MMLNGGRLQLLSMKPVNELIDLCVGNRVDIFLLELWQDMLLVPIEVGAEGLLVRILLGRLKEFGGYDFERFALVRCVADDGRQQGLFVEVNGELLRFFGGLALGCLYAVLAVVEEADPVEA